MKLFQYGLSSYSSEMQLRKAIYQQERKLIGKPRNEQSEADFWIKHGVIVVEEEEPIEELKSRKASAIKRAFLNWRNNNATLISSLGFKADSNERANSDVSGLLVAYEDNRNALITFRDADNEFHSLTYTQVKTLQKEIIANGNFAYEQKWILDARIESATTKEEIESIEVVFVGKNFFKDSGDL